MRQSLEEVSRCLRLNPRLPGALALRASIHASLGRPNEARADADAALRLDPASPQAGLASHRVYALAGNHAAARTDLAKARALLPDLLPDAVGLITTDGMGLRLR